MVLYTKASAGAKKAEELTIEDIMDEKLDALVPEDLLAQLREVETSRVTLVCVVFVVWCVCCLSVCLSVCLPLCACVCLCAVHGSRLGDGGGDDFDV